ncbi:MAG: carbohydrate kinase family protein [Christensenellales bacterium]|jgi:fructokinase
MYDVTAIGEVLIDFTPAGTSQNGNLLFEQNPGGAPTNCLAAVVRCGGKAALISAVGKDQFGVFLKEVVQSAGIEDGGIQFTDEACTTLAFVTLSASGERNFSFCRKPGADQRISAEKIDKTLIENCKIFHYGSLSLSDEPARSAVFEAVRRAQHMGKLVSYDPNWRPPLWSSREEGVYWMKQGIGYADVLKVSDEELALLSGFSDPALGTAALMDAYPRLRLVVTTLGDKGCFYRNGAAMGYVDAYEVVPVDTTGAGDAFWGTVLYHIAQDSEIISDEIRLAAALDMACAAGALCASGRGAIPSIADTAQIKALQARGHRL